MHHSASVLTPGGIAIPPGLLISFQRFAWPACGIISSPPASLGALPLAISSTGELLLPVAVEECFWIGLSLANGVDRLALTLAAEMRNGKVVDVLSGKPWKRDHVAVMKIATPCRIAGITRPDSRFAVLARQTPLGADADAATLRFHLCSHPSEQISPTLVQSDQDSTVVVLVDYATFAAQTRTPSPEPLDPSKGYAGWRLP